MSFSNPEKNVEQFALRLGSIVADFGSGSGHYALAMARAVGEKGKVYAVDIQKDLLDNLKKDAVSRGLLNVEVLWGDVEKEGGSKLKDGILDAVLISNLLFQVKNKEVVLAESKRVLKGGGRLLIIDWSESFGGIGPDHASVFPESDAKKIAVNAGFEFDRDIQAGEHHYGLVFRKP